MIKAILFDLEGTIVHGLPLVIDCLNELSPEYGYNKITDYSEFRDKSLQSGIKENLGLPFYQLLILAKKLKSMLDHKIKGAGLVKDIKSILKKLSSSYTNGFLTLVSRETVQNIIENNEIKGIKFVYYDSPVLNRSKIITEILEKYGFTNSEVIYVGDKIGDIRACKKAGIKMIAVSWGYNSKAALQKENPEYLIDKPEELLEILKPF